MRMAQEKPYQFSADIPARPNYRYVYHVLSYLHPPALGRPGPNLPSFAPARPAAAETAALPLSIKKGKAEGPSLITSSAPFTVLRIGSVAGPLFARISFAP